MGILKFQLVNTIKSGNMFGELGIIYSRQRAATCIAMEDIELGYMNKEDFFLAFDSIQKYEERCKVNFIEDYVITDKNLKYLSPKFGIMFKKKNVLRGSVIFRQGQVPNIVIFIIKGQIGLRYSWKILDKKNEFPLQFSQKVKKSETFVLLCRGESIGEEALFKDRRLTYDVISDTECDFYYIEIDKLRNLCTSNKFIKDIMEEKVNNKIQMIQRRMEPYFKFMMNGDSGIPTNMLQTSKEKIKQEKAIEKNLPEINSLFKKTARVTIKPRPPELVQLVLDDHNGNSPDSINFCAAQFSNKKKQMNYRNFDDGILLKKANIYRPISGKGPKAQLLDDDSSAYFGVKNKKKKPVTPKTLKRLKKKGVDSFDIKNYTKQHQNLMKRLIIPLKNSLKKTKNRINFYSKKKKPSSRKTYDPTPAKSLNFTMSPIKKKASFEDTRVKSQAHNFNFNPALSYMVFSNTPKRPNRSKRRSHSDHIRPSMSRETFDFKPKRCEATKRFQKLREFNKNMVKSHSFYAKNQRKKDLEIGVTFEHFLSEMKKGRVVLKARKNIRRKKGGSVVRSNYGSIKRKKKKSFNITFEPFG